MNDPDPAPEKDIMAPASTAGGKLFDDLRHAIETGRLREGDRIAPIRELAAKYNIAFDTARATVGRLEKLQLVRRRRGAGTFVTSRPQSASEPQTLTAPSVGLLINSRAHLFDHLTADLVDILQRHGLACIKLNWREGGGMEQIEHVLKGWRRHPPRAVVIQSGPERIDKQIDEACGGKSAIVLTFRNASNPGRYSSVNPDNNASFPMAAQAMLDRGHKKLGLVITPRIIRPEWPFTLRKRTSDNTKHILDVGTLVRQHGIKRHGVTFFYNIVGGGPDERTGIAPRATIDRAKRWLETSKPTGIIGNDFRLIAVYRAAEAMGLRIGPGGDIEFIGIGNTPWAEAFGFDSMSLREDLIAKHVAHLITDQLDSPNESAQHIVVAPKLVVRALRVETTSPPPVVTTHEND